MYGYLHYNMSDNIGSISIESRYKCSREPQKLLENPNLCHLFLTCTESCNLYPGYSYTRLEPGRGKSKSPAISALSEPYPLVTIRARKMRESKLTRNDHLTHRQYENMRFAICKSICLDLK